MDAATAAGLSSSAVQENSCSHFSSVNPGIFMSFEPVSQHSGGPLPITITVTKHHTSTLQVLYSFGLRSQIVGPLTPNLISHIRTQKDPPLTPWCQTPQGTARGPVSKPLQVRAKSKSVDLDWDLGNLEIWSSLSCSQGDSWVVCAQGCDLWTAVGKCSCCVHVHCLQWSFGGRCQVSSGINWLQGSQCSQCSSFRQLVLF